MVPKKLRGVKTLMMYLLVIQRLLVMDRFNLSSPSARVDSDEITQISMNLVRTGRSHS